jgi:hypothetical protein
MIDLKDLEAKDLESPSLFNNLILKSLQNIESKVDELGNKFLEQDKVQIEQDLILKSIINRLDRVEKLLEENNIPLIKHKMNDFESEFEIMKNKIENNSKDILSIKNHLEEAPIKQKAKLVDYVFKYGLIAIGGLITLKITGILTAIFNLIN